MTTDPGSGPRRPRFPRWLRFLLGALVVAVTFYFLVTRLVRDWNSIPFSQLHFNLPLLLLSLSLVVFIYYPLGAYAWKLVLKGFGETLPFDQAFAILTTTLAGKYIPGKVWFTLGRMSLAKSRGIPQAKTGVSVLVESGLALLSASILFGVALLFIPRAKLPAAAYWAFSAIPVSLIVVSPKVLNRLLRFLLPLVRQPVFELKLGYGGMLHLLLVHVIAWFVQGLGCFLLVNSFYRLPVADLPVLLGGQAMSWILGFIVLVAPAGLGIREGFYTLILARVMPEPMAILSALVSRIWLTGAEMLLALIGLGYLGFRRKRGEETQAR